MIQFSNSQIRAPWLEKKFMPSNIKNVSQVKKDFATYSLVGDKKTGALMVQKEYVGKMARKKPTELWLVVGKDPANKNKEGILTATDAASWLKSPTERFDSWLESNGYSLYAVKGLKKKRSTATKLIEANDFFELRVGIALCEPYAFTVFGKEADYEDFGTKEDRNPNHAKYGCSNMQFIAFDDEQKVAKCCEKYKIDKPQFDMICEALAEGLSFGSCSWCV